VHRRAGAARDDAEQLGLLRDLARIAENELNREELSAALAARARARRAWRP
jgi:hypothetical protein